MIFVWWNTGVREVRANCETATVYLEKQMYIKKVSNDVTWLYIWRHFIICLNKIRQNVLFCPTAFVTPWQFPNLNLNSSKIWLLTLFPLKSISCSLNYKNLIFNSPQQTNNAAIFLSCDFNVAEISPIRTPSAYEVISQRKWPSSYEWITLVS